MWQAFLPMAIAYALVATRMAGFVATSPFPGPLVAMQARIGLVLLLALAAAPAIGAGGTKLDASLVGSAIGELATGSAIGFLFRIATVAADVLGASLAHAMGLTMASTFDAAQGATVDPVSRLVTTISMVLALAMGAHRVVIGAVIASVQAVPLGTTPDLAAIFPTTLDWLSRSFDCGLGLALPCITVSMSVQLALALVGRAAPALQVFSVGLSVTIASGILVVLAGARDILGGLGAHYTSLAHVIDRALVR